VAAGWPPNKAAAGFGSLDSSPSFFWPKTGAAEPNRLAPVLVDVPKPPKTGVAAAGASAVFAPKEEKRFGVVPLAAADGAASSAFFVWAPKRV
jgi:hypothetical protein